MTCLHLHDANDQHVGSICVPGPCDYQVAVHRYGARKWDAIGGLMPSIADAFQLLGTTLAENRRAYDRYNRAGIWAVERGESYYEPRMVYEVTVR